MSAKHPRNISWCDGSPVEFLANCPHLVIFDPLDLDALRLYLTPAVLSKAPREALRELLNYCEIGLYEIPDFSPGLFSLEVQDIRKFDSAHDISDEDWETGGFEDENSEQIDLRWFGTDSGCFLIVEFDHLKRFVELFAWETYDLVCRAPVGDNSILLGITKALGGPYYALVMAPGEPFDFDGDGTYTLQKNAVKRLQSAPHSSY